MNIMHVISSFHTGGAEKLLIDTVKEDYKMNKLKSYVCIINNQYSIQMLNELRKYANVILIGKSEKNKNIKYIYKFIKILKESDINIVHCHNRGSYKFALLSKVFINKLKIVYTIHDTNIYNNVPEVYVKIDRIFIDKFIAISKAVEDNITMRGISPDKIKLIHNGIDVEKYNLSKELRKNEITIGCVARLVPEKKGQDILIKAISKVKKLYPNVKCKLAGEVPIEGGIKKNENKIYLEELAKSVGVYENIDFLGNVDNIPEFLKGIDIFVLPSRYEGFGLSLIEAISSKTPVIASNIDGPREIIKGDKYGLLFEKENECDLSEKIIQVILGYEYQKIENAYLYVNENYSVKSMYKKYYDVYQSVFNKKY